MAGTITALIVQAKNKERVNVHLDGEVAFGLAMIEALRLRKGQVLSDAEIERLKALDEIEAAHEKALNFLSYRPRSVAEVRRNLARKGISQAAIETVVGRLQEAKLLDDQAFANYWVENRESFEPRSARALRFELRQKGVAGAEIAGAVGKIDEEGAAYRAALSLARRVSRLDRQSFSRKVGDFLIRRGFATRTARDVIKQLWEEYGAAAQEKSTEELSDPDWGD